MKSVLAASAVMALAGSSYGFTLISVGISPGSPGVSASSGSIVVSEAYDSSAGVTVPSWSGAQLMVTGAAGASGWSGQRAAIMGSSWFGIDPRSPGAWSGGTNAANARPMWTDISADTAAGGYTLNLRIGTAVLVGGGDGNNLVSNINAGANGMAYAPQRGALNVYGGAGNGAPSTLASGSGDALIDSVESVFVGHFTLTDANAALTGFIAVTLDGQGPAQGFDLPLDGSFADNGVAIVQVRNGTAVDVYVAEVPAPGALAAFGLAGLAGIRRRR